MNTTKTITKSTMSQLEKNLREAFGETDTTLFPLDDTDQIHQNYLGIQEQREADTRKYTFAAMERHTLILDANKREQEFLKREIAKTEEEIAKKVPGTLRELKKHLKELKEELKTVKIRRGIMFNGGVW
jgi:molybdopterin converting factor small subunit